MATSRRSRSPQVQASPRQKSCEPPADLLTFRWKDEMVYITPSSNFEELVSTAQQVFPQLLNVSRDRIAFSINTRIGADQRPVRISCTAWPRLFGSLARFEIVDVHVLPFAPRAAKSDTDVHSFSSACANDVPPQYYDSEDEFTTSTTSKEKEKDVSSHYLSVPADSPQLSRRRSSALGWLGDKLR